MNSKERLFAAVAGKPVDQKPTIIWPHDEMYSDAAIVSLKRLANVAASRRCVLVEMLSPFSRALKTGLGLSRTLSQNPKEGEELLGKLVQTTKLEIELALQASADGIFYRLQGAEPEYSTPMEYGGLYLEADREILEAASSARLNVVFVEGGPDLYIDFVSDLPAQLFAWDEVVTGLDLKSVRKLRRGALATADPDADVLFGANYGLLQKWAKKAMAETNV